MATKQKRVFVLLELIVDKGYTAKDVAQQVREDVDDDGAGLRVLQVHVNVAKQETASV